MIILPFGKKIGQVGPLGIYRERSLHEWLRDELPEGSKFVVNHFEVDGDEAHAKVQVRLPCDAQRVEIKVSRVELPG